MLAESALVLACDEAGFPAAFSTLADETVDSIKYAVLAEAAQATTDCRIFEETLD